MSAEARRDTWFEQRNLRTKMMLVIAFLIVCSLSAMIFLATLYFKSDNELRVMENNHQVAQLIGDKVKSEVRSLIEKAQTIATISEQPFAAAQKKRLLKLFFGNDRDLFFLGVLRRRSGKLRYSEKIYNINTLKENRLKKGSLKKLHRRNQKFYKRSFNRAIVVHNASRGAKVPVVALTFPFSFTKKKVDSIVILYARLERLAKFFQSTDIVETFLVDARGDVITHSNAKMVMARSSLLGLPIVKSLLASKIDNGQSRYQDETGEYHLGSFRKLEGTGLGVVATVPEERAFAAVYNIQRRNLYILGIVLGLAFVVAFFFSKTLSKPIVDLVDKTMEFQEGDFKLEDIEGKNEISYLTNSFGEMVGAIRKSQKQLQDYAENLENKVEERTAQLSESNEQLSAAKDETDNIMKNLNEGLFLLDKELKIGDQYSAALDKIFEQDSLGRKPFVDLFATLLPTEEIESLVSFLDLMFQDAMDDDMLVELNPIDEVLVTFPANEAVTLTKYLSARFYRIYEGDDIRYLMVTVSDVTERVRLREQLELTREKTEAQTQRLFTVLHVEPTLLRAFIDGAELDLQVIKIALETDEGVESYSEKLELIYRSMHSIKGNASILEITFIADRAHRFEESISQLQEKEEVAARDFLPLAVSLAEMIEIVDETKGLVEKLLNFQSQFGQQTADENVMVLKAIKNTVSKVGGEIGKEVEFVHSDFDQTRIPMNAIDTVRNTLVQFVRNSIIHGIETPQERESAGKPASGRIELRTPGKNGGGFEFILEDDGRGLQVEKLRSKAKSMKKWSDAEIDEWSPKKLGELIFMPGLSTAETTTMHAGRGMGMDIIKAEIEKRQGTIDMTFEEGKYTRFVVKLPVDDARAKKGEVDNAIAAG